MSAIRPLEQRDLPVIANMLQRVLRKEKAPAPTSLTAYLGQFYLDAHGDGITSLVHTDDAGEVSGFIGVHGLPMIHGERRLRAAICSSFMVEKGNRDPMAGARLMKAFLEGPQDLSFSETANRTSTQMWTRLRGTILPQYSLDWIRVIRPAAFALGMAGQHCRPARLFTPLASAFDRLYRKRLKPGETRWAAAASSGIAPPALRVDEVDHAGFAQMLEPLTAHFPLRPRWADLPLEQMLADGGQKPDLGEFVLAGVTTSGGSPVGAFAYHARPHGIARVLQVLARPGQEGAVIDCLIGHAAAHGVAALRGRTQPALLAAMLTRRIAFLPATTTIVHSRDAGLVGAMASGQAFLNGLAGEEWSRLIGGRFT
ncbi:hypothetical protein [Aquamicrobium terrae]|uniref:GNAT family N-acetyltransferase n=1 Tax=Aquamicrobium terrae TaxID=1324945 RepID=A0ABV2MZ74_9HYPH